MFSMREIFLCASLGCGVGGDARAVIKKKTKNKLFPPQSFSSGHSKKPPHWDYLVICSPNFYEVAFPFDFLFICALFFMLYIITTVGVNSIKPKPYS